MKNISKRIAKTVGIGLCCTGTAAFVSYAVTNFLIKTAMNRDIPKAAVKAGNKISGIMVNEDFMRRIKESSKQLENTPSEEINITAHDGTKLVGHWISCENPKRIILAMHGWRSSWHSDFGMVSETWKNHDCSVLYAEQRGQNNSGGEYMGFGLTERHDCVDWIGWIMERCGTEIPIYLAGVSMGATTVLMASGLDLPNCVHGIMSDCGFTSPDAIWRHIVKDNLHIAYGLKGKFADEIYHKKIQDESAQTSTVEALAHTDIPVLFVHGTDDHFVPVTMTYDNYKACASPKHLLVVPGADHGMSYYINQEEYEKVAEAFWEKYDNYDRAKVVEKNKETITGEEFMNILNAE